MQYMSIIVWIIAPTPVHIRTADCVHLGKMPYIRYISTCVWILPAPCRRCIHSGNCVYLKKYRTYGIFPQWFGLLHQYQYAAIVSISKNTEHTVVMYILVLIIAPAPYMYTFSFGPPKDSGSENASGIFCPESFGGPKEKVYLTSPIDSGTFETPAETTVILFWGYLWKIPSKKLLQRL